MFRPLCILRTHCALTKAWPGTMTNLVPPYFFLDTLCINHTSISPATKTIKVHVCSAANPTAFPKKLKMAPTTLPTIAGNGWIAFPANPLSASGSLSNHFFKTLSSFDGEPPAPPPPPKTHVIARTNVQIVIESAVRIGNMVVPCSRNKARIVSAKDVFLSRNFSRFCLILATCVWRSFRFYYSISSLACFSVFKSSNLSLCNYCLCSSE